MVECREFFEAAPLVAQHDVKAQALWDVLGVEFFIELEGDLAGNGWVRSVGDESPDH